MPSSRYQTCSLLTIHGRVLVMLAREPHTRMMLEEKLTRSPDHMGRVLTELQGVGLVTQRRQGRSVWYVLAKGNLETMAAILRDSP